MSDYLSANGEIYSRVYFPVHANDLKSVAGCLGFRWSAPEASGLQSIVWRRRWETTGDQALQRQLLTYNQEDCSALERAVDMLRSLGAKYHQAGAEPRPRIAGVQDIAGSYRHQFGTPQFALPEFARITKCAYFDYQRDKIICRTNPTIKKIGRGKGVKRRPAWKVNREVECGRPDACTHCGSDRFDQHSKERKLVIDLKPFHGGIKRWVTRYKVTRYRCRKCMGTCLPADYLAISRHKYGWGLCNWVAYSIISLRNTNDAVGEALNDLFSIPLGSRSVSKIRQRVVERYRATYELLLAVLRNGVLVHADETKVKMKGVIGDGYVWAFANPQTAVYVYSPTREGNVVRDTLKGFKGVLVSDFYAAYDSLVCPQQKCLIHLIRDFNDDLLKHPFDEELKQMAARFTTLLQAVIETVDHYGLKKYHLHKHKKDVDQYFTAESRAGYMSELATHYQHRVL